MDQTAQVPNNAESESMPGWKKQVTVFLVGQTVTTFGSMLFSTRFCGT